MIVKADGILRNYKPAHVTSAAYKTTLISRNLLQIKDDNCPVERLHTQELPYV